MFYLTEESFNSESIGYYYNEGVLKFKNNSSIEVLSVQENYLIYESDQVNVKFSKDDFSLIDIKFNSSALQEINLSKAAEMYFLLKNLTEVSIII